MTQTNEDLTLVGKCIASAEETAEGHLLLRFDDGTSILIEGLGYDGLWTDVIWSWSTTPQG